jgi:hypothetical protein
MLTVLVVDCAANRGPKSLGHPVNEAFSAFQFNSLDFPIAAAKHPIATLSQQVLARQRVALIVPISLQSRVVNMSL